MARTGRPLMYKNKKQLKKLIDEYFAKCDAFCDVYTVTGLARHLGMSRQDLINYSNRDEFFDTIRDAKLKIEEQLEHSLYRQVGSVTGIIFNLKNNYGWKDQQDINANVDATVEINVTNNQEEN